MFNFLCRRANRLPILIAMLAITGLFFISAPALGSDLGLWELRENIPLGARYSHAAAVVDEKLYVFGGCSSSLLNLVQEYNPATRVWSLKSPMSAPRCAMAVVAYEGKIYVLGGNDGTNALNTFEVYDPAADSWTVIPNPMPTARYGLAAVVLNGKIYAMGGRTGNVYYNIVEVYDIATDTWLGACYLPTIRYYFDAVVYNGKIYAAGGIGGSLYDNLDIYDPATNSWTAGAPLSVARSFLEVAEVNGKIYAFGGVTNNGPLTLLEEYDPVSNTWGVKQPMIYARRAFTAGVIDGKIYTVAGVNTASFLLTNTVEQYTPPPGVPSLATNAPGDGRVTLMWNKAVGAQSYRVKRATTIDGIYNIIASDLTGLTYTDTSLTNGLDYYYRISAVNSGGESDNSAVIISAPRQALYPWMEMAKLPVKSRGVKAVTVNGKIYVLQSSSSNPEITVYEYNSTSGAWTEKTTLPGTRLNYGVVAENNKIYIIGGANNDNGQYLTTVQEYDPVTDSLVAKISMPTARANLALAAVNHKIYAIGGINSYGPLLVTEEYDPYDTSNGYDANGNPMGRWVSKANCSVLRSSVGYTATNDKIYLIGGYNSGVLSNAVEEYDPATNSWTYKAALPTARAELGAVAVEGRIYAIGGGNSYTQTHSNIVEEYNPGTNSWTAKPTIVTTRLDFGITEQDGSIYIIGGEGGLICWDSLLNSVEKYTPTPLTAISNNSIITLTWYAVGGAQSYTVKRADNPGGAFATIASNLTTVSYTDSGLMMGRPYYYMVYTVKDGVEIAVSNEAWALLGLMAPTNFTAVWEGDHFRLDWGNVSKATGYYFKRSSVPGGPYTYSPTPQTANFAEYDGTQITLYVVVSAVNADGESPNSSELTLVFP
ncbi:MAG TPA: kelch repeat-containing protein [Bacillota bacterium]|nr:kelch repeat-containing protein [Bacillota bacterium]